VLGLVRRDLLLDVVETVAPRTPGPSSSPGASWKRDTISACLPRARRIVRDLLVIRIDPARLNDPEIASDGERDRLKTWPRATRTRT